MSQQYYNKPPTAVYRTDGTLELAFPYDPFVVERLKATIPPPDRRWHPERKVWTVALPYAETALLVLRAVFGEVIVTDWRQTTRPPFSSTPPTIDPDCRELFVLPDAPRCVIDAAYRALSKVYHPDRLPDGEHTQAHERMVTLNAAYGRLRDRAAS